MGAGTVEFLIDSVTNDFYFCEMNTRLQVEHPVTELITGTDLVEWQLRVASGQPIPLTQEQIISRIKGHAIEARIYAENPLRDFLPASGYLAHLRTPADLPASHREEGVRVDSGVIAGNIVSTFYDPMIAKLIVYADNRELALEKLERSLRNYQVAGLPNNIDFIIKVARHHGFTKERATTAFFSQYMNGILDSLKPAPLSSLPKHSLFGTVCYLQSLQREKRGNLWDGDGEFSYFRATRHSTRRSLKLKDAEETFEIAADIHSPSNYRISPVHQPEHHDHAQPNVHKELELKSCKLVREAISDRNLHCAVMEGVMEIDGVAVSGTSSIVTHTDGSITVDVWLNGQVGEDATHYQFNIQNPAEGAHSAAGSSNPVLTSPMPGKVVKVLVADGEMVKQGQPVVILEAMKMEHVVAAPSDG